jgi:predicted CXXCH cytochrome family protein
MPSRRKKQPPISQRMKWTLGIIAGLFVFGIAIMFGATRLENHDSFCASCHTEGEVTFYKRSLTTSVDLASFHTTKATRCIDCHTGPGIPGRVGGLMAGASDLVSYYFEKYPQPAVQDKPILDSYCLKCHAKVEQDQNFQNHFHAFLPQWQAIDSQAATCVSCHVAHDATGDAAIGYLNKANTIPVCQKCHQTAGQG